MATKPAAWASHAAAFSDVDDTLIVGKSLVSFARLCPGTARVLPDLFEMLARGVPRAQVNRIYYQRVLGGLDTQLVDDLAQSWFEQESRRPGFFRREVVRVLSELRDSGARVVLVTGSFPALMAPVAEAIGGADIIAAPLETSDGTYTGALTDEPTIGAGKTLAVRKYAHAHSICLAESIGIGDDESDAGFLELLGRALVPGDAPQKMLRLAETRGWTVLTPSSSAALCDFPAARVES